MKALVHSTVLVIMGFVFGLCWPGLGRAQAAGDELTLRTVPEWLDIGWRHARAGKWVETMTTVRDTKRAAKALGVDVPAEELRAIVEQLARYKLKVLRESARRGAADGNRGMVRNAIMGSRTLRRRFGLPEIPRKKARLLHNRARRNKDRWPRSKRTK